MPYVLRHKTPQGIDTEVRVRAKQRELGVEADGIWGPITEAAYQKSLAGNADAQAHTNADLHQKTYLDAPNSIDAALADKDAGTDMFGQSVPPSGTKRGSSDAYSPLTMAGLKLAEQKQSNKNSLSQSIEAYVKERDKQQGTVGAYGSGAAPYREKKQDAYAPPTMAGLKLAEQAQEEEKWRDTLARTWQQVMEGRIDAEEKKYQPAARAAKTYPSAAEPEQTEEERMNAAAQAMRDVVEGRYAPEEPKGAELTPEEKAVQARLREALEEVHERKLGAADAKYMIRTMDSNGMHKGTDGTYIPLTASGGNQTESQLSYKAAQTPLTMAGLKLAEKIRYLEASSWEQKLVGAPPSYYVESDKGNIEIGGKRYFRANSGETVSLYAPYTAIDYNFENTNFMKLLNAALIGINKKRDYGYVIAASQAKGQMDQKKNLYKYTLYLFDGVLYNKNEAGNIIWGAAMQKMGFGLQETLLYANGGALISNEHRLDEPNDQWAIEAGWRYSKAHK